MSYQVNFSKVFKISPNIPNELAKDLNEELDNDWRIYQGSLTQQEYVGGNNGHYMEDLKLWSETLYGHGYELEGKSFYQSDEPLYGGCGIVEIVKVSEEPSKIKETYFGTVLDVLYMFYDDQTGASDQ